jgi:hypothetical protein
LFVIGGFDGTRAGSSIYRYEPFPVNRWTSLDHVALPQLMYHHSYYDDPNDVIHIIGGPTGGYVNYYHMSLHMNYIRNTANHEAKQLTNNGWILYDMGTLPPTSISSSIVATVPYAP